MRTTTLAATSLLIASSLLSACAPKEQAAPAVAPAAAVAPAPAAVAAPQAVQAASRMLGQWNGPEGTYLLIGGANGQFAVTVRNLDGPRTFQAMAEGDTIRFERDGKQETIRATDGRATGMKWLADKKDCLTISPGEGYCRD